MNTLGVTSRFWLSADLIGFPSTIAGWPNFFARCNPLEPERTESPLKMQIRRAKLGGFAEKTDLAGGLFAPSHGARFDLGVDLHVCISFVCFFLFGGSRF